MEIVSIFEEQLYAFQPSGEVYDEYTKLFYLWQDIEYLRLFFKEHVADLEYYKVSVDDAVQITLDEAEIFENEIRDRCKRMAFTLDEIFLPLDNNQYKIVPLRKSKAYGTGRKSWLRIYALRIDNGLFVVTGGAIKLTKWMQQQNHTQAELDKIDKYRDYLKDNGVVDSHSLFEIIL